MKHQLPQEFLVEYGPLLYPEEAFSILKKGDSLVYTMGRSTPHQELIYPTKDQWANFWQEMEELGLWDWNPSYQLCCLDGTQWKVKIVLNDLELESSGENHYPDTFLEFWEALEELLGLDLKLDI